MTFYEETLLYFLQKNISLKSLEKTFPKTIFIQILNKLKEERKITWNGHCYKVSTKDFVPESFLQELFLQQKLDLELFTLSPYQFFFLKKKLEEIKSLEKNQGDEVFYFTYSFNKLESLF